MKRRIHRGPCVLGRARERAEPGGVTGEWAPALCKPTRGLGSKEQGWTPPPRGLPNAVSPVAPELHVRAHTVQRPRTQSGSAWPPPWLPSPTTPVLAENRVPEASRETLWDLGKAGESATKGSPKNACKWAPPLSLTRAQGARKYSSLGTGENTPQERTGTGNSD